MPGVFSTAGCVPAGEMAWATSAVRKQPSNPQLKPQRAGEWSSSRPGQQVVNNHAESALPKNIIPLHFGLDVIFLGTYRPPHTGLRRVANVHVSPEV